MKSQLKINFKLISKVTKKSVSWKRQAQRFARNWKCQVVQTWGKNENLASTGKAKLKKKPALDVASCMITYRTAGDPHKQPSTFHANVLMNTFRTNPQPSNLD